MQENDYIVCTINNLDWSLFHKNHDILIISCSGKDFDILKPWNFSDFKNLKNWDTAGSLNFIKRFRLIN